MKYLNYILIAMLPLFCSSCLIWWNNIPPGDAPEGPILKDPLLPETTLMTGKMAVNHLTTSLVMKCPAITESVMNKPIVINEFVISSRKVNHLQMEVWRSLINMNMINPVCDMKENPSFNLVSEITRLPERVNGQIKYSWIMSMHRIVDKKEIWREEIEFGE